MNARTLMAAAAVCLFLMLAAHAVALACPVCYGNPDSSSAQGMNAAILSLLGVTGGVLGGFASMFLRLRRRAKTLARDESRA